VRGDGSGTVTSSPAGVTCPGDCSETWQVGTAVTLSATTDPGTVFDGWVGGGCFGTGSCELTVSEDEQVVALCNLEGACGLGDDMTLDSISIDSDQELEACSSITVGSGLVVEPPSHLVLRSGSIIVLEDGFTVLDGASLTIEIYPDVGLQAAIGVAKTADPSTASEGDPIVYTISVENIGEVPLAEVSVVDAKCDAAPVYQSGDDGDSSLEVGETWLYECSGTAEPVTFVNTATATFEDAIGVEASDSGTATVTVEVAACTDGARFEDLGDGTIYDCWTKLIWLANARCPDLPGTNYRGYADWSTAASAAGALADGTCGLSDNSSPGDWRLPSMSELCGAWSGSWASGVGACDETLGLINDNFTPALSNSSGDGAWTEGDPFSNVASDAYWSSDDYDAEFGWAADFSSSVDINTWYKTESLGVWPVRGGQ
jgi:VCBS repeat-containing protein